MNNIFEKLDEDVIYKSSQNKKLENFVRYNKTNKYDNEMYMCQCGCYLQLNSKPNHLKTKTHKNYVISKINDDFRDSLICDNIK
jgi:hypothetical protein